MSAILNKLFNVDVTDEVSSTPIVTEPTDFFKLPIEYLDKSVVHSLSPVVAADLELDTAIYTEFLQPKTEFDSALLKRIQTVYTSDVDYLQNTQELIQTYQSDVVKSQELDKDSDKIKEIWNDIYVKDAFHERHGFLDIKQIKTVNKMETFMGYWTIMNLVSPVFSILLPFMFLLAPFIILRIRQVPINFSTYLDLLKDLAKSHAIGKTLTSIENFSINNLIYMLFTLALYGLQMYQNCQHCNRFYHNISAVNANLLCLKNYVDKSIYNMEAHLKRSATLKSYATFNGELRAQLKTLYEMRDYLADVQPFESGVFNMFKKCFDVGYLLKTYYCLYDSVEFREALGYAIGFEAYRSGLYSISQRMAEGHVNVCVLNAATSDVEESDKETDKGSNETVTRFVAQVYPPHSNNSNVMANTISLKKNVVITGPNASGKTTQLKTTAINVILTQQYGVGYYQTGQLVPYTHIHSYLNIPDTSGRDSLFQAEARRCKEIIDIINASNNDSISVSEEKKSRHFCIFDELFSGTNADEATGASFGFLKYLQSYKNVDFILTTHFVNLCKKINSVSDLRIVNYKMDAELVGEKDIKFSYKFVPGISKIKAARLILIQMGFPDEIVAAV